MLAFTARTLAARKLRTGLTALAIVLGVALVSGTLVLLDSVERRIEGVYSRAYESADLVVTARTGFGEILSGAGGFDAGVLDAVRAVPGVESATAAVVGKARLVGRDGRALGSGGPPLAFGIDPRTDPRLNPLDLVAGEWPRDGGEVAIDAATAQDGGYAVGDRVRVSAGGPARAHRIAGLVELGGVGALGGGSVALFAVGPAQSLFAKPGKVDIIRIAGDGTLSAEALERRLAAVLPGSLQIVTGLLQAEASARDDGAGQALGFLRPLMLALGGAALLVGGFGIANTLSVTLAQRTRELATLRVLGASRRQVLASVVAEALAVGLPASAAGLLLGLGVAEGLAAALAAAGVDLPAGSAVLELRTVLVALAAGPTVTLAASLRPARRAMRVAPIAAVAEGAAPPPPRGPGALLTPRVVVPLVRVLGWPASRFGGPAGRLARANSARDPRRTASCAFALAVGLALVTVVAVLGAGLRSGFVDSVDRLLAADYVLTARSGFDALSPEIEPAVAGAPGVTGVTGVRSGEGRVDGEDVTVAGVGAGITRALRLDWREGTDAVPASLGRDGAFVTSEWAASHRVRVGSRVRLATPAGGTVTLVVRGVWDEPRGGSPLGAVTVSHAAFAAGFPRPRNDLTLVTVAGGARATAAAGLERALADYPDAKVQTGAGFKAEQTGRLARVLNLLYLLLGLSVVVGLLGIVNTLALTVVERTRELGLLRAVGLSRRHARRMIRHESIITALLGATVGIAGGVLAAAAACRALAGEGFAFVLPLAPLGLLVAVSVVVGVLAAALPARRAAQVDVLRALARE